MISGLTLIPSFWTIAAASKTARACISEISGILDAEAASAEAEHRVELVELLDPLVDLLRRDAELLAEGGLLLRRVRQEFVQRRIEEADRRRKPAERAEDSGEVVALVREQLREGGLPRLERFGEDHLAHRVDPFALEEHVLGPAQPDARRAERDGVLRLLRRVGVGAHLHARRLVAPFQQLLEVLELLGRLRGLVAFDQAGTISDGAVFTFPANTLPAVPSIDIQSPSLNVRLPTVTVRA